MINIHARAFVWRKMNPKAPFQFHKFQTNFTNQNEKSSRDAFGMFDHN